MILGKIILGVKVGQAEVKKNCGCETEENLVKEEFL